MKVDSKVARVGWFVGIVAIKKLQLKLSPDTRNAFPGTLEYAAAQFAKSPTTAQNGVFSVRTVRARDWTAQKPKASEWLEMRVRFRDDRESQDPGLTGLTRKQVRLVRLARLNLLGPPPTDRHSRENQASLMMIMARPKLGSKLGKRSKTEGSMERWKIKPNV
ncbi:hypothetical protein SODALDRAFT_359876 [Sodiomyces alkalinus F11]|uniref:Uncharacterized protein n=1 Tax=Sodiomyces alkalinus (strain CBS 110278 / VKM F-3762 / F11) TaxID=1314773 RepID=A0A3N2PWA0_SODAK|nr:hypothetical protein SODALDRAFT_359876 [Sodiomyces alkalinus F11]ROT38768.1 hypothetical protein SODALDRAFT_359876 [Sodiomyces alkalinus F11]